MVVLNVEVRRWLYEAQEELISTVQQYMRTIIVSQTNTGKTTFVYALVEAGYKVLLVSPYRGIVDQQRATAWEKFGDNAKVIGADEIDGNIETALRTKDLVVSTWDKLARHVDHVIQAKFDFIILDEIHELTNAILYRRDTIRVIYAAIEQAEAVSGTRIIGLTATLSSAALQCDGWNVVRVKATDAQKYSFLIHEYTGKEQVAEKAVVKWLDKDKPTMIICDNKRGLKRIRNYAIALGYPPESIHIVTAENKMENEAYRAIVEEERLPEGCKLLLCTSVLATGVNIRDENLQIVLLNPSSPDFAFQAAGRIRAGKHVQVHVWCRRNKKVAVQPFTTENQYRILHLAAVKRAARYNAGKKPRVVNALRAGRSKYSGLKKHHLIERNGVWIPDRAEITADAHSHGTIRIRRNIDDFTAYLISMGATVEFVETVVVEEDKRPTHVQDEELQKVKDWFFSTAKENPNWIISAFYACTQDRRFKKRLKESYSIDEKRGEQLAEESRKFAKQSIFTETYFIEIMRDALGFCRALISPVDAFRIAIASRTGEVKRSIPRTLRNIIGVYLCKTSPFSLEVTEREEFGELAKAVDALRGRVISSADALQELNALLPSDRRAKSDKEAQGILTDFFGESERRQINGKRERVYNCTTLVELPNMLQSIGISLTLLPERINVAIAAQEATQVIFEAQEAQREEEEEREAIRSVSTIELHTEAIDVFDRPLLDMRKPYPKTPPERPPKAKPKEAA